MLSLVDIKKIDEYFNGEQELATPKESPLSHRAKIMRWIKIALPSMAALLIGLLIVMPGLQTESERLAIDVTRPKKGELEKLHMEQTSFYITDANNKVNNFNADNIDETEPGSKLLKLKNPSGILPNADNTWVNIQSPIGYYNQNTSLLRLLDGVELFYSNGATATSEEMFFDFKLSKAHSVKPTTVDGESGHIEAQGFEYYQDKDLLIFTGKTHITMPEERVKGDN